MFFKPTSTVSWLMAIASSVSAWTIEDTQGAEPFQPKIVPGRFIIEYESSSFLSKRDSNSIASTLSSTGLDVSVNNEFDSSIFQGASIQIINSNSTTTDDLKKIDGVKNAWQASYVTLDDEINPADKPVWNPHVITGVDSLHERGIKGKGVTIAVLDTGVDYMHPALGGGIGPDFPIIGGYDFSSDAENPGSDPMDCAGHGTFVSSVIVGNSDHLLGVAPEAKIKMYKVFGCEDSTSDDIVMAGMLKAYEEKPDVMSLSLGSNRGYNTIPIAQLASRIAKDVPIMFAAGNSGGNGPFMASSGGSGKDVLSIGSTHATQILGYKAVAVSSGGETKEFGYVGNQGKEFPNEGTFKARVFDGNGCTLKEEADDRTLVIARRGTCFIGNLYNTLSSFKAALLYPNSPTRPLTYLSQTILSHQVLQNFGTVSYEFSQWAIEQDKAGNTIEITISHNYGTFVFNNTNINAGQADSFSSWGPTFQNDFYPSVSAPGGSVFGCAIGGSYSVGSGTSFACPYVAGLTALYLGTFPNASPADIRTSLMGTAKDLSLYEFKQTVTKDDVSSIDRSKKAPIIQQGAGLIDALKMFDQGTKIVSSPYLELNDTANRVEDFEITIKNTNSESVTYDIVHIPGTTVNTKDSDKLFYAYYPETSTEEASVTLSNSMITLGPGDSATVHVNIKLPTDSALGAVFAGKVFFNGNNGESVAVSYMGVQIDTHSLTAYQFPPLVLGYDESSGYYYNLTEPKFLKAYDPSKNDSPVVFFNYAYGTEIASFDLVDADYDLSTYKFPPVAGENGYGGPLRSQDFLYGNFIAFPYEFVARFNAASTIGFKAYSNGTFITSGKYRILSRSLRTFGNRGNLQDWDLYLSDPFAVLHDREESSSSSDSESLTDSSTDSLSESSESSGFSSSIDSTTESSESLSSLEASEDSSQSDSSSASSSIESSTHSSTTDSTESSAIESSTDFTSHSTEISLESKSTESETTGSFSEPTLPSNTAKTVIPTGPAPTPTGTDFIKNINVVSTTSGGQGSYRSDWFRFSVEFFSELPIEDGTVTQFVIPGFVIDSYALSSFLTTNGGRVAYVDVEGEVITVNWNGFASWNGNVRGTVVFDVRLNSETVDFIDSPREIEFIAFTPDKQFSNTLEFLPEPVDSPYRNAFLDSKNEPTWVLDIPGTLGPWDSVEISSEAFTYDYAFNCEAVEKSIGSNLDAFRNATVIRDSKAWSKDICTESLIEMTYSEIIEEDEVLRVFVPAERQNMFSEFSNVMSIKVNKPNGLVSSFALSRMLRKNPVNQIYVFSGDRYIAPTTSKTETSSSLSTESSSLSTESSSLSTESSSLSTESSSEPSVPVATVIPTGPAPTPTGSDFITDIKVVSSASGGQDSYRNDWFKFSVDFFSELPIEDGTVTQFAIPGFKIETRMLRSFSTISGNFIASVAVDGEVITVTWDGFASWNENIRGTVVFEARLNSETSELIGSPGEIEFISFTPEQKFSNTLNFLELPVDSPYRNAYLNSNGEPIWVVDVPGSLGPWKSVEITSDAYIYDYSFVCDGIVKSIGSDLDVFRNATQFKDSGDWSKEVCGGSRFELTYSNTMELSEVLRVIVPGENQNLYNSRYENVMTVTVTKEDDTVLSFDLSETLRKFPTNELSVFSGSRYTPPAPSSSEISSTTNISSESSDLSSSIGSTTESSESSSSSIELSTDLTSHSTEFSFETTKSETTGSSSELETESALPSNTAKAVIPTGPAPTPTGTDFIKNIKVVSSASGGQDSYRNDWFKFSVDFFSELPIEDGTVTQFAIPGFKIETRMLRSFSTISGNFIASVAVDGEVITVTWDGFASWNENIRGTVVFEARLNSETSEFIDSPREIEFISFTPEQKFSNTLNFLELPVDSPYRNAYLNSNGEPIWVVDVPGSLGPWKSVEITSDAYIYDYSFVCDGIVKSIGSDLDVFRNATQFKDSGDWSKEVCGGSRFELTYSNTMELSEVLRVIVPGENQNLYNSRYENVMTVTVTKEDDTVLSFDLFETLRKFPTNELSVFTGNRYTPPAPSSSETSSGSVSSLSDHSSSKASTESSDKSASSISEFSATSSEDQSSSEVESSSVSSAVVSSSSEPEQSSASSNLNLSSSEEPSVSSAPISSSEEPSVSSAVVSSSPGSEQSSASSNLNLSSSEEPSVSSAPISSSEEPSVSSAPISSSSEPEQSSASSELILSSSEEPSVSSASSASVETLSQSESSVSSGPASSLPESETSSVSSVSQSSTSSSSPSTAVPVLKGSFVGGHPQWDLEIPGELGPWTSVDFAALADSNFLFSDVRYSNEGKTYFVNSTLLRSVEFTTELFSEGGLKAHFGGRYFSGQTFTINLTITITRPDRERVVKRDVLVFELSDTISPFAESSSSDVPSSTSEYSSTFEPSSSIADISISSKPLETSSSSSFGSDFSLSSSISLVDAPSSVETGLSSYASPSVVLPSSSSLESGLSSQLSTSDPISSDTSSSSFHGSESAPSESVLITDEPHVTSVVTKIEDTTTVITITSCEENKCSETTVTTGLTVVTSTVDNIETIYTTYCPLTTTSEALKATITTSSCDVNGCIKPPTVTTSSCDVNGCIKSPTVINETGTPSKEKTRTTIEGLTHPKVTTSSKQAVDKETTTFSPTVDKETTTVSPIVNKGTTTVIGIDNNGYASAVSKASSFVADTSIRVTGVAQDAGMTTSTTYTDSVSTVTGHTTSILPSVTTFEGAAASIKREGLALLVLPLIFLF